MAEARDRGARRVEQFGPAPGTPGGMAAVIEAYLDLPLDGYQLSVVPTYHPDARLWSGRLFALALARLVAGRGREPAIAHLHLSERGSFAREGALAAVAARLGIPVVVSLHGADFEPFLARHPAVVRNVLGRAQVVCALGPRGRAMVEPYVAHGRVEVLPNPAALPPDPSSAGDQDEVVFFAGEVGTRKGVDVLVRAWSRVVEQRPAARLVVAGPTADVPATPAPGIDWVGVLPRDEVQRQLQRARVAVLPSRAEVMPMFLLEAMAAARPVVATDVGEVRWLVGDGGTVVAPGDDVGLAAALTPLLASPAAATRIGGDARRRVEAEFSPAAIAARLGDLYGRVLATAHRG